MTNEQKMMLWTPGPDAIWNPPIEIYFSKHSINPKGIISVLLSRIVIDIHMDDIEP